jgi:hypothetical protein
VIGVRTACGLGDERVNDPELEQVRSGQPHRLRGALRFRGTAPQDGGATFRRDHRVDRVLQREHYVADAERERAARATLAKDDDHDRRLQPRHQEDRLRDRLGLPALLALGTRVRAGRVDERDERQVELLRKPV